MAHASPKPSKVELPLPSSSMMIKEFLVALCKEEGGVGVTSIFRVNGLLRVGNCAKYSSDGKRSKN